MRNTVATCLISTLYASAILFANVANATDATGPGSKVVFKFCDARRVTTRNDASLDLKLIECTNGDFKSIGDLTMVVINRGDTDEPSVEIDIKAFDAFDRKEVFSIKKMKV